MKEAAEFSRMENRKRGMLRPATAPVFSSVMWVFVSLIETLNIRGVGDADVCPQLLMLQVSYQTASQTF